MDGTNRGLSVTEAARLLGVSRVSVYRAAERGELASYRIGHRVLIPRAAVARLLGGQGAAGAPPRRASAGAGAGG